MTTSVSYFTPNLERGMTLELQTFLLMECKNSIFIGRKDPVTDLFPFMSSASSSGESELTTICCFLVRNPSVLNQSNQM